MKHIRLFATATLCAVAASGHAQLITPDNPGSAAIQFSLDSSAKGMV